MNTNFDRVGQISICWSAQVPSEARAKLLGKLSAIRTRRQRATRPNYERARRAAEARGAEVLAAPDHARLGRATHIARIYYRSQGDEILCFEAVLGHAAARALVSTHRQREAPNPKYGLARGETRFAWCSALGSDAVDAELFPLVDAPAHHPLRHGARRVVLPSQHRNPVQAMDTPTSCANEERAA